MTIYDLRFHGVYFPKMAGGGKVRLSEKPIETRGRKEATYAFEVTVLKQYGTKQDVLWLQFADGHSEYITLYEPVMYLEDGEWKLAPHKEVVEEFLAKFDEQKESETIGKNPSLFDLTFYGLLEDVGLKMYRAEISLFKVARDRALTDNNVLFTATILKEYKDKKYVVKAVTDEGESRYLLLFNPSAYYDEEKRKWTRCNENPIPAKILKCYIEYLNG